MVRARTLNYLWHEKEKIMNARTTLLVLITLFYLNHTMAQKYERNLMTLFKNMKKLNCAIIRL